MLHRICFRKTSRLFLLGALLGIATLNCEAAKVLKSLNKVPGWVIEASEIDSSLDGGEAGYALLHNSMEIEVDREGRARVVTRKVLKVTGLKGRSRAVCLVPYLSDTEKVESLRAWVFRKDGTVVQFDKKDIVDSAHLSSGGIVSTERGQGINAVGDVRIGSIFVSESVTYERGYMLLWTWFFDVDGPSLYSSLKLTVPEGWDLLCSFANMDTLSPSREGNTYHWSLRNLDPMPDEDWAPSRSQKTMEVGLRPPVGSRLEQRIVSLSSWSEYSAYFTKEYEKRTGGREVYAKKVAELTDPAGSRGENIRRLASFARSVNYVSIGLELGMGGGWFPRSAAEVCDSNYGDCKDKSNMLCHMLAEIGVKAYPVIVNAGLRHEVVKAFPSGRQFNHCIAAIECESGFEGGAIVNHPDLGRLLIFDPTDELTALGDLPIGLQGSKGLLLAGDHGGLIELPQVERDQNLITREIEAEVFPDGSLVAKFKEESVGQEARSFRLNYRHNLKSSDFVGLLKNRISRSISTPTVSMPEVVDDLDKGSFELSMEFGAPQYAKTMGGSLIIFKPILIDRRKGLPFEVKDERILDIIVQPDHFEETTKIYIPEGYRVSEYAEPVSLRAEFGSYENDITVEGDTVLSRRRVHIDRTRIPASDFDAVKTFYEQMSAADQASVVLEKI